MGLAWQVSHQAYNHAADGMLASVPKIIIDLQPRQAARIATSMTFVTVKFIAPTTLAKHQ